MTKKEATQQRKRIALASLMNAFALFAVGNQRIFLPKLASFAAGLISATAWLEKGEAR
ncbi:hypothetical protein [Neorhizobium sp. DT-125]|uniref:hypothetical protein n=1 Tax=Neorhizobium sp. DT-125 TaxID=3396163 RepID=UPI003F1AE618